MKPKWLIEDFDAENRYDDLAKEVARQGMEVEVVRYLPFESGDYNQFGDEECVVVQASLNLAVQLQKQKKWVPGPWLNTEAYECTSYYPALGSFLFNDDYTMLPRGDVPRMKKRAYDMYGRSNKIFVRPSTVLKSFSGQVILERDFDKDWEWIEEFSKPSDIVVISSMKTILAEWRVFVAGQEPVTWCQYKSEGESVRRENAPLEVRQLAETVARNYEPDPIFCVDICQGIDYKYYLMEIGSFSCAGLYACDVGALVSKASQIALRQYG